MEKYYQKDFLDIFWLEDANCVKMVWKKFARGKEFREGLNKGLELIIKKKSDRWLADLRKMQVLSLEDQQWSNEVWFPRAIEGGIRKMAIVKPASALAKMGVKNIMNKVGSIELKTAYYDNEKEALSWLTEV